MQNFQEINDLLRSNEDAQRFHRLICDTLKNKDFIFADLIAIAEDWDFFFIPHESFPDARWWAVACPLLVDEIGRLNITICRIVLVPLEDILKPARNRKELFYQEFELAHEFGHIVVFENEDLTKWLNCPFMRLSPQRKCPYIELRAFEEGIKIFEDILEKYDKETKPKQKVKKFFRKIYLLREYRKNFSSDCVINLDNNKLALQEKSDFCPLLSQLKEVLARLDA